MSPRDLSGVPLIPGVLIAVTAARAKGPSSFRRTSGVSHSQAAEVSVYSCPGAVDCAFLDDVASFPQFDPALGKRRSVELRVASDIDVLTRYNYGYDSATTRQWCYSEVTANANGLEAAFEHGRDHHRNADIRLRARGAAGRCLRCGFRRSGHSGWRPDLRPDRRL